MDAGIRPGARNPSALLMSLIRKAKEGGGERENLTREQLVERDVEDFLNSHPDVDEAAAEALRQQDPLVAECVLTQGPFQGRNPSALLMKTIREAKRQVFGDRSQTIEEFIEENRLDDAAVAALYDQEEETIRFVISHGPISGRNPSSVVMSIIRQATNAKRNGGEMYGSRVSPAEELRNFIKENGLDSHAEEALRKQTDEVIQAILSEGPLRGRNPSALLVARIRQITSTIRQEEKYYTQNEIDAFAEESGLDGKAHEVLSAQSDDLIRRIIDEGPLRGRNPSALLMARIRQLGEEESRGSGEDYRGGDRPPNMVGSNRKPRPGDAELLALEQALEELEGAAMDFSVSEVAFSVFVRRLTTARKVARTTAARRTNGDMPAQPWSRVSS